LSFFKKAMAFLLVSAATLTFCLAAGEPSKDVAPVANAVSSAEILPAPAIKLNGNTLDMPRAPYIKNGTTFVSFYDFFTLMGLSVTWENSCAYARSEQGFEVSCVPYEIYFIANGRALYLNLPSEVKDDRLYIPVRAAAAVFDLDVAWDDEAYTVILQGGGLIKSGDEFYDHDTLYWLSRIISAEARGEPLSGQIAVGNVVFNRVADAEFPNTVYGVIFDRQNGVQFTPADTGEIYDTPYDISVTAAKLCLEGVDFSLGATYFISDKVKSCYATRYCNYLMRIGGHRFYG